MRRIIQYVLPILPLLLGGAACADRGSGTFAGVYQVDGIGDMTSVPIPLQPPFREHALMDSIKDTLTLYPNRTYRESGTLWYTSPFGGPMEVIPFQAIGRYIIEGNEIVLTPDYGSTVGGGVATLNKGVLTLSRYPGVWIFRRMPNWFRRI